MHDETPQFCGAPHTSQVNSAARSCSVGSDAGAGGMLQAYTWFNTALRSE
jgi:hypothetical protein